VRQGALPVRKGVLGRAQEVGFTLARGNSGAACKGRFDSRFGTRKARITAVEVLAEGCVDGGDMGAGAEQSPGRRGQARGGPAQHTEPHRDAGGLGHSLFTVVAHELHRGRSDDPFGQQQPVCWASAGPGDLLK
jgi:hypothetical protein